MNKISVIQNGFKDCAAACLLSIIRYYGGNISKEEINYIIKTNKYGTNAYNLIEGAKTLGFSGYGIKKDFNELLKYSDLPVIAHAKVSNMYHYVVIYKITNNYIQIMDPSVGLKKLKLNNFEKIYLGTLIYLYPVSKIPNVKIKDKIANSIIKNILINKKSFILLLMLSLIITVLSIINSSYLKIFIDYISINFTSKLLIIITVLFIMVIFLKNILSNIRQKLLINIKLIVSKSVTNDAFNHIMHLPYHHIKNKPTGEIISRLNNLENFKDLISSIMLNIFANIFLILVSMIVLIIINKKLFLLCLIVLFFYSLIVLIYSIIFKRQINNIQIDEGEYNKNLVETINGYETIKNLNLISEFVDKAKYKFNRYLYKIKLFEYSYSNEKVLKDLINDIGLLLISSFSLYLVYKKVITIGDMVMFTSIMLFFTEPIKELLDLVPNIRYAMNSYERINEILIIEPEDINNAETNMIDGNINIENLSYTYNNLDYVFKNISLTIKKGEKILIYGKSGCGKSTFIKILLKYFNEYGGSIKIGNNNLKDINNDLIRNTFSYISQNEILLSDSIKNNIILNRNINNKLYNEVLRICKVDKIIDNKPLRDNYLLEEDGFNLSGGERQKIMLARGLLKKFNILVLDEVLSEVGFKEEIEIIKEIFKKYKNKTIIYVSHKKEIINFFNNKYLFGKDEVNA